MCRATEAVSASIFSAETVLWQIIPKNKIPSGLFLLCSLQSSPEVAAAVARAKDESRLQKERANALQAELLNVQMDALPSPEEVHHVLLFVGELDAIALRNAVNTLTGKYSGYCGIFAGDDTNGYRFIVGSASCNCQELADRMRRELSAKGRRIRSHDPGERYCHGRYPADNVVVAVMTILSAYIRSSAHEFRVISFHMKNPRHDHLSYSGGLFVYFIWFSFWKI